MTQIDNIFLAKNVILIGITRRSIILVRDMHKIAQNCHQIDQQQKQIYCIITAIILPFFLLFPVSTLSSPSDIRISYYNFGNSVSPNHVYPLNHICLEEMLAVRRVLHLGA